MNATYNATGMYKRWLIAGNGTLTVTTNNTTVANPLYGKWSTTNGTGDWHAGFWPGCLWMLSQRTGNATWLQRAIDWSAPLANSTNGDHDIGFITMASMGKARLCSDDLTDPGGGYRAFTGNSILVAAGKLDSRFNKPVGNATVPANMTRSWDGIEGRYPVCIDNMMNLEVLLLGHELGGNLTYYNHALAHARSSIAKHLRADGSTYHVVRHFESSNATTGNVIGAVERKNTRQGFGDETTWSRGQAWAVYGFTMVYRYARRGPDPNPEEFLAAAQAAADYFIDHLPNSYTSDTYNHRIGDFVPPSDFDAALGEPVGPWNDADNDALFGEANSGNGSNNRTFTNDRFNPMLTFTLRDSSAAAIVASALVELSRYAPDAADRERYLATAEDILECLVTYDGTDPDADPDYLSPVSDPDNPGILRGASRNWGDGRTVSTAYADYFFLEAMTRYEALLSRELLIASQRGHQDGASVALEFQRLDPAPALMWRVEKSPTLGNGTWTVIAARTGAAAWTGPAIVTEDSLPGGLVRVRVSDPTPGNQGFFRVRTLSAGGMW